MRLRLHSDLPIPVKRLIWEVKYGLLNYGFSAAPKSLIDLLCKSLPRESALLDLGCGSASLLPALRATGWAGQYCGVDISTSAISKNKKMGDAKSSWIVSDIESFETPLSWDAVVMLESAYYVKLENLAAVLRRLSSQVKKGGFFVFRFHDTVKYQEYISQIRIVFPTGRVQGEKMLFCPVTNDRAGLG